MTEKSTGLAASDAAKDDDTVNPVDQAVADAAADSTSAPAEKVDETGNDPIPMLISDDSAYRKLSVFTYESGEWKSRLLVLLFAGLIFLPNLGSFGLWDPWETHYGEVSRSMIERNEWISPRWGQDIKVGTPKAQGNWFWSKPIFIFWSEILSIHVVGLSELAVRLPIALLAMLAVFMSYIGFSTLFDRKTGWWAAVILATCPMYFFIGRQAQTDMPFVASMIIALNLFLLAVFKPRQKWTETQFFRITLGIGVLFLLAAVPQWGTVAANIRPHRGLTGLAALKSNGFVHLLIYVLITVAVFGTLIMKMVKHHRKHNGFRDVFMDRMVRKYCLFGFYIFCGFATMAKGLLGFMLPGAIIFFFLLVSKHWILLKSVELFRGIGIFVTVGWPWYNAMFVKHPDPGGFYNRFFIHDHFNRLGSGVHQIDGGTFEHFIKWLGIGMFPWVVFVPATLASFALFKTVSDRRKSVKLFLFLWFFVAYTLFTLSSTKFHHYIFPALPGLGLLVAVFLRELWDRKGWQAQLVGYTALGMMVLMVSNLLGDQQHLRNLFTYQYTRKMPTFDQMPISDLWTDSLFFANSNGVLRTLLTSPILEYHNFIGLVGGIGIAALVMYLVRHSDKLVAWIQLVLVGVIAGFLVSHVRPDIAWYWYFLLAPIVWGMMLIRNRPHVPAIAMVTVGILMATWGLNYYLPSFSPHWSQKYLFDKYYQDCTRVETPAHISARFKPLTASIPGLKWIPKVSNARGKQICKEKIIGWLLTWRGETFYSHNTLYKLEANQLEPFLNKHNGANTFYIFAIKGGVNGFKNRVTNTLRKLKKKLRTSNPNSPLLRVKRFDVNLIFTESIYFELGVVTPVMNQR